VLTEHPAVVTLGRQGGPDDIRLPVKEFKTRGIKIIPAERGGRATYHGPGQLVAYPIVLLENRDMTLFMQTLLEATAATIKYWGLTPKFRPGEPGLWVQDRKIASAGAALQDWVSFHGIALNVSMDLTPFKWIVPCGRPDQKMTTMARELKHTPDIDLIKNTFINEFMQRFDYHKLRRPFFIRTISNTSAISAMEATLKQHGLNTVCSSANCPNLGECFGQGTAAFMILGNRCTRECRFCAVSSGAPLRPDPQEPLRVAQAVKALELQHVVVTSVTRDDLADGGAAQFALTIEHLRANGTNAIEVLTPDFRGSSESLRQVLRVAPDVFNHNVETVPRLYSRIRPLADSQRSLNCIREAAEMGLRVKSGLMLGLGETDAEIEQVLKDLIAVGCMYVTMGQYLAPTPQHAPVARYLTPEDFENLADLGRALGFKGVAAGPLVRSSYRAAELMND